jgi:hypothetical protein
MFAFARMPASIALLAQFLKRNVKAESIFSTSNRRGYAVKINAIPAADSVVQRSLKMRSDHALGWLSPPGLRCYSRKSELSRIENSP